MSETLTPSDIKTWQKDRPDWTYDPNKKTLCRDFKFGGFSEAFGFMARVALAAEKLDHHPDWSNVYDRVSVCLSTHSAGGVTKKDLALAEAMDRVFTG